MFDKSEKFPEGWFFIKNHSNGYVLMVDNESQETGIPIVLSTLRTKDYSAQLWRYDHNGYLVNKKSGQVMDVAKGTAKAGVDIVQQVQSTSVKEENNFQKFGLSPYGHIYLVNKPSLILGIKESFFSRREGLHVHLQLIDKRHLDRKEQRWDFVLPVVKEVHEPLKRSASSKSTTSTNVKVPAVTQIKEDDVRSVHSAAESTASIDQNEANTVPTGSFPDTAFFLKSDAAGLYISIENASSISSGTQLTLELLRKRNYESQLWTYDASSHRIVNKFNGLVLGIAYNHIKDGADIIQTTLSASNDKTQAWTLSTEGEITLKHDPSFVIGFKESWFGSREGAHLHLQKKSKHINQKFTVVLPVFKKSTETTVKTETRGVFPEGWFFVKSQARGLVLTVLETGVIAAEVAASKLDKSNYSRQLWKYDSGFIVNKASEMVLDVRGGALKSGAGICQYTRKEKDNENQQWALTPDGAIYLQVNKGLVLTVKENEAVRSKLYLSERKSGHKEQCWNFVLPVFRKKTTTVTKTTFRYATYPSDWFFIRSYHQNSTTESPLVLTAHEKSIELRLLDKENWHYQLWTFSSGKLINYATDLVIDVSAFTAGAELIQSKASSQKWYMTTDGYLFYGSSDSRLALSIETQEQNKYRLTLSDHKFSQEFRWGFLIPKFVYRSGIQVLTHWSVAVLKEWRVTTTTTKKITHHPIAEWPQGEFYIRGPDDHALTPEKSELGSRLIMKKLEIDQSSIFKWTFRNGYLVHCATGLVMRAQDAFAEGKGLVLSSESKDDIHQLWTLRTDGSIISKKNEQFGLGLVEVDGVWTICITTTTYYSWRILYGRYETRYSEKDKREISYLVGFRRVVLTTWTLHKHNNVERKLVTHSYGVFPQGWVFIRSKCDDNLFVTVSDKKKGAKLILAKLDFKNFKRQLWRYREDGCITNFDTDYVIDVAGGRLFSNANIIQWSPKFLRSSRKNQVWSLSVEGHIHPESNANLVLSTAGNHAKEGAELKLIKRGDSSLDYQQWTFATPVFSKCTHTSYAAQQANKDSLVLEKVGNSCSVDVSKAEKYERVNKRVMIRRWGVFPDGSFFIRCAYGKKNLALTVERDESSSSFRIVIRSLNFKAYKWQLWTYKDGYLVNEQTGLVLDAQASEDIAIEGEQPQVYLKEKASNEGQFWDLGVDGEIHLRSNERLAIGVANAEDASVEGARVRIKKIKIVHTNVGDKEVTSLKSDQWLRWSFTKPVFGKRTIATTTTTTEGESALEVEKVEEQAVVVKEKDEEINDDDDEDEEEEEENSIEQENEEGEESEYEIQTPVQTPSSSTSTVGSVSGVAVVAAGTAINVAAGTSVNIVSSSPTTQEDSTVATVTALESPKSEMIATVETPAQASSTVSNTPTSPIISPKISPKKSNSSKSQRLHRKDSFQLEENYIPTGFEKVVRYKTHHGDFPEGYFFIKSSLHGFVLDIIGDVKEGSPVALTRMRASDYASQLWSYQDGFLVNLKGQNLVLDAAKAALVAGERIHLSSRSPPTEGAEDQTWEHSPEGFIHLKTRISFVLSLKETKRSDKYSQIDVFVQEAKSLVKKLARPEQHWEVLIPALIPVSQGESGVKIIESGKVEKVTSSASAIISYKWLKETYCHKVTAQNQWPETEGWFFIRFGTDKHFLASGETAQSQVGLYEISENLDYRRFLWTFIDGYLINYKYLLRLVLSSSHRWILSNSHSTLNQKFYISANGSISVRIAKIIYYIRFIRTKSGSYILDVTSDSECKEAQGLEFHIPVISDVEYQKKAVTAFSSATTWIRKQKTDWAALHAVTSRRGVFPASTWFFMKVVYRGSDDLVLSVQEGSSELVLKKLDFKTFKEQLWTFNDGLLINYGSKYVIDVEGKVSVSSKIVHKAEAGVSTQKWFLTADGRVELESHDFYTLGAHKLEQGAKVLLSSSRTSSSVKSLQWKFSTPVFGKKTTSTSTTMPPFSSELDITQAVEQGAVISGIEEVSSPASTQLRVAPTAKHYYVIYRETRLIISWWRIIFIRRLSNCRTQKEYLEAIEEYRRILYGRFAQYIEANGSSVSKDELLALENTIQETKDTLEMQVFSKTIDHLNTLKSDDIVDTKKFDVSTVVTESCQKLDKKYENIVNNDDKITSTTIDTSKSTDENQSEAETTNNLLVTVDTVHITIRYWFRTLYIRISEASKNGAKKDEIEELVKDSHRELETKLNKLKESTSTTLAKTTSIDQESKKQFEQSIIDIIDYSKLEIGQFVSNVDVTTLATDDNWRKTTAIINDNLSLKAQETKNVVQEYNLPVQNKVEAPKADESEIENSKIEVVTSLAESKAYITTWYSNISKDITWALSQPNTDAKKDTLTLVDAAELDIMTMFDETVAALSILSGSLTYLTWSERRRLITYYINMKTTILANLKNFKTSINDADKDDIVKFCKDAFGEEEQSDVLKHIDYILETAQITTTTKPVIDAVVKDTEKITVGAIVTEKETLIKDNDLTRREKTSEVDVATHGSQTVNVGVVAGSVVSGHKQNVKDSKKTTDIDRHTASIEIAQKPEASRQGGYYNK
ncbi:uncharacterized protein B0P05DRAFT_574919 [Gilbertella persicaria]|uniref:uncharacterized protein n=1 Tax=Gilbertella persicaria TaxID=101096 RepID=UPI0022202C92|nr:uncharacterized protein B0P05DRAFT_574919 [Gilbertella persicaria]KAI8059433.1 hypothetical protein B0P05DRAFT_574919 [Gilbertella persicaria]